MSKVIALHQAEDPGENNQDKERAAVFGKWIEAYFPRHAVLQEATEIANFGKSCWNMGTMAMQGEFSLEELMDANFGAFGVSKQNQNMLHGLIDDRIQRFGHYNFIIDECSVEKKNGGWAYEISTMTYEAFIADKATFEDVSDDDEEGSINRSALLVHYRPAFLTWLASIDEEDDIYVDEGSFEIFLIDEDYDETSIDEWLAANYLNLFTHILELLQIDETDAPKDFSLKMFNDFFKLQVHINVIDMVKKPIVKFAF
jgi:hypothetical protein